MYNIISLKHTNKNDKYITLWRSNKSGYCYSKEMSGLYDIDIDMTHFQTDNMLIQDFELDNIFIKVPCNTNMPIQNFEADRSYSKLPHNDELRNVIPNCPAVWEILKVKMTKNGLRRLHKV